MLKKDFVNKVAEKTGLSQSQANNAVNAVFESVVEVLESNDEISIQGFGSFKVKERAARTGRNPSTGEEMEIAASKAPAFKASSSLKAKLNK